MPVSAVEWNASASIAELPVKAAATYLQIAIARLSPSPVVELPRGFRATLPKNAAEQAPQGSWSLRYAEEDGKVTSNLVIEMKGGTVAPQDYAAFRSFLGRLDQAVSRKVEAAPPARTAVNEAR